MEVGFPISWLNMKGSISFFHLRKGALILRLPFILIDMSNPKTYSSLDCLLPLTSSKDVSSR